MLAVPPCGNHPQPLSPFGFAFHSADPTDRTDRAQWAVGARQEPGPLTSVLTVTQIAIADVFLA